MKEKGVFKKVGHETCEKCFSETHLGPCCSPQRTPQTPNYAHTMFKALITDWQSAPISPHPGSHLRISCLPSMEVKPYKTPGVLGNPMLSTSFWGTSQQLLPAELAGDKEPAGNPKRRNNVTTAGRWNRGKICQDSIGRKHRRKNFNGKTVWRIITRQIFLMFAGRLPNSCI